VKKFNSIMITGASSGIGEAVAHYYAREGVTLFLSGRNEDRLGRVASACQQAGATVYPEVIDVSDQSGMAAWIDACDARQPLDLVIANAGISAGVSKGLDPTTRKLFSINIDGVLNTFHPALDRMRSRKSGQIAIVSSMAGLIGLPSAPGYSASKAAVRAYGEALRGRYRRDNVGISVIVPGFVTSGITAQNRFPMPFLMSAEKAARIIAKGLAHNKARIAFPKRMYALILLISALPMWLTDRLFSKLPDKK
jgi:short-subunit dehydrogenase